MRANVSAIVIKSSVLNYDFGVTDLNSPHPYCARIKMGSRTANPGHFKLLGK